MIWLYSSAVALVFAFAADVSQAADQRPTLRIFNHDLAGVPAGALARAKGEASRVLRAAGLEVRWYDCPQAGGSEGNPAECGEPRVSSDLVVRVLPQQRREYRESRSRIPALYEILGHALCVGDNRGTYINIYWKSLLETVLSSEKRASLLLGYAITHEVGHLLLGPDHTTGIMASDWIDKSVLARRPHELLFSVSDSSRLIQRARSRVAASPRRAAWPRGPARDAMSHE